MRKLIIPLFFQTSRFSLSIVGYLIEKMIIIEEIFNSPLRSSFTYVDYEIGSVSKKLLAYHA